MTELSGSGHDSSYYDDRSDHERERHREKKKKKKKKSEKEKYLDDEERRKRKVKVVASVVAPKPPGAEDGRSGGLANGGPICSKTQTEKAVASLRAPRAALLAGAGVWAEGFSHRNSRSA